MVVQSLPETEALLFSPDKAAGPKPTRSRTLFLTTLFIVSLGLAYLILPIKDVSFFRWYGYRMISHAKMVMQTLYDTLANQWNGTRLKNFSLVDAPV
jgi:hypothetical protein